MTATGSELQRIHSTLRAWDTRLRLRHSLEWLPRGLAGGLLAAGLLAVAARLWPIAPHRTLIEISAALALLGMVSVMIGVWVWQRSALAVARRFDALLGLKERLSTALEVAEGRLPIESDRLAAAQRRDAVHAAASADPRRALPLRVDWREWAVAAIVLGLLIVAVALPNPQDAVLAQQAQVQQAIAEEIDSLDALRQQALTDPSLTDTQRLQIVDTLDQALSTLSQQDVTQQEAFAALDTAQQQLQDMSQAQAAAQQQALQAASGQFSEAGAPQVGNALQQGDLQGAGQALSGMLDTLTPDQAAAAASQLSAAAEALQATNPDVAQALDQAAQALQQGDTAGAQAALDQAGQAMQQAGQGSAADGYSDKIRKDQQSMADAGQGSQPGQNGMGQAQTQGSGQGSGSSDQPQQGTGSGGAGRGAADGPAQGGVASGQISTDNGAGDGGETPNSNVYAPQRVGGEGGPQLDVPGNPDSGIPIQEGEFANNPNGQASVPYTQVYGDYSSAANQALDSGYVPLGLRGLIQQYFTRLDPSQP